MTSRPGRTTIDLGPGVEHHKAALETLATALGLGGNLSALIRLLAETSSAAPQETAALLEAAHDRAAGGDEWNTLAILKDLLPPIALSAAGDE